MYSLTGQAKQISLLKFISEELRWNPNNVLNSTTVA